MATQAINDSMYTEYTAANQIGSVPRSFDKLAATASAAMGVARAKSAALPMEAALQSNLMSHLPDALAVEASDEMLIRLEKHRKSGSYASDRTSASGSTTIFSGSVASFDAAGRASAALVENNGLDWKSSRDQQVADINQTEGLMRLKSVKERESAEKERKSTLIRSFMQIGGAGATIIAAGVALKWAMSAQSSGGSGKGIETADLLKTPGAEGTLPAPASANSGTATTSATATANTGAPTAQQTDFVPPTASKKVVPEPVTKTLEAPTGTTTPAKASGGHVDSETVGATGKNGVLDKNANTADSLERRYKLQLIGPVIAAISQLMNALGELLSMNYREGSRLATADATELGALAERKRGEGEFMRSHAQARIQNGFDPLAKALELLNQVSVDRLRAIANPSA